MREGARERPAETGWSGGSGLRFIILFGVVSLFADMTYEGARSVTGPFLGALGASGLVVGVVAGLGEMLGYVLRLLSGRAADRSRLYWPITLGGYLVQLPAVPVLALAGTWPVAGVLIVLERIGKAMRNPPRDVMLAQAGRHIGQGWGFGVHEAMDQAGALLGPLGIAAVLALWPNDFRRAFAWLAVPAATALVLVFVIRAVFPSAGQVEREEQAGGDFHYPAAFWWYVAGAGLFAFGFADYPLIAYHFAKARTVAGLWVPIFYALAMGAGGLGALVFGKLFDRFGLVVLVPVTILTAGFAPLVFLGGFGLALAGALLWGIGLGIHESVMPAAVATMIPHERRGMAYGMFTAVFGVAWFAGSAVEGGLYDQSILILVIVAMVAHLAAIGPILKARAVQNAA